MCVQNLVPIGPQATTCIPSEGYTHRQTDRQTDTHTLSYIDIDVGLCFTPGRPVHSGTKFSRKHSSHAVITREDYSVTFPPLSYIQELIYTAE